MRRLRSTSIMAAALALLLPFFATAHEGPRVVPEREHELARENGLAGPAENRGVESVERIGGVDLGPEFEGMEGKELRVREITIAPGGVIAVHRHDSRPGVAYILEGEIVEHRNDADGPITRKAGDAAFEKSGVTHWWENESAGRVRALVVDIVDR